MENSYGYDPHGRSFDCASCDRAARGSAQDDSFVVNQILRSLLYVDTEKARSIGKKGKIPASMIGVAGPSTAPLAMKLQEAPLRMTVLL